MTPSEETPRQLSEGLIEYLQVRLDNQPIAYRTPLTPMEGGYETRMYHFSLSGVAGDLSGPLVLRLFPPHQGPGRVIWESTVQNTLADHGYPVARAYLACTDASVLGGVFFIMTLLPGQLMITLPLATVPGLLGQAHAALHDIDPGPLVSSLREQGFVERDYRLGRRLAELRTVVAEYPWLGESTDWLLANRPREPDRLAVCHGDFHPLNILVQEGRISGVVDWGGLVIADPVMDVANTIVLSTIPAKHLFSMPDMDKFPGIYLEAYRAHRALDLEHLDYYLVRRCVTALLDAARGNRAWGMPAVVEDLVEQIHGVTGIRAAPPGPG